MSTRYSLIFTALIISLMLFIPAKTFSQVVKSSGTTTRASSQLVYHFNDDDDTTLQVTNTNDVEGTWIHVQFYRVDDPDEIDNSGDEVICDERNFVDFLTPNDTHVYEVTEDNFVKNIGETETTPGEMSTLDLTSTQGFALITPVVSESDLTAKSFQHLIGQEQEDPARINALGRDAVDFTTGEIVPDNTPLDGVTNGFVVLQPDELLLDILTYSTTDDVEVVAFSFEDTYGPQGLLGYTASPAEATLTSFIYDHKEDPTSCGDINFNCFMNVGINSEDFLQEEDDFLDGLLCDGTDLPEQPGSFGDETGWIRMFTSELGSLQNLIGFYENEDIESKRWMNTNRDEVITRKTQEPSGTSTRATSQLLYYYDDIEEEPASGGQTGDSVIQVTNTNDTTGVWVHVQIFRSFDAGDDIPVSDGDELFCDERNFVDFLTPNDTHVYDLRDDSFTKNIGEAEDTPGESTSINVDDTKGFVVVTPVVSESDFTAISFQHLIGSMSDDDDYTTNTMGRDAVDLTTGEIAEDGTPLDGETAGFATLRPEEFLFQFADDTDVDPGDTGDDFDVIGIVFKDNYGPSGLLGYNVTPGDATWTSFIFDFKEDPTSCGDRTISCFSTAGLNDTFQQGNQELTQNDLLCGGTETPDHPGGPGNMGWTRIFVSGLEDNENHIALWRQYDDNALDYLYTRGEVVAPDLEPPAEDCAVEGDEDGDGFADCLDTDCATAENCETGPEECTDGVDNDEDGATDCADLGCDGTVIDSESGAVCETGGETSCNDGFDNDGDGDVDGADSDCQTADTGGTTGDDGGDGGGCTVASTVTAGTAAANFLLPLLPLAEVYGFRRLRRRNSK